MKAIEAIRELINYDQDQDVIVIGETVADVGYLTENELLAMETLIEALDNESGH